MKRSTQLLILLVAIFCLACNSTEKETDPKAQEIIDASIAVHGGDLYSNSKIEFDFRDKTYGALRKGSDYTYARTSGDSSKFTHDLLINGEFAREVDGKAVDVTDEFKRKYSNSINSVIYFAVLPYGLNDPAVIKEYLGEKEIKGKKYHKIGVSFIEKEGGEDFDDEFVYWINMETNFVDYLAYAYHTDGAGTRFREAYNARVVNGIRFADYINYEGSHQFESVTDYDDRFVNNEMKELSRIELSNIYVGSPDE